MMMEQIILGQTNTFQEPESYFQGWLQNLQAHCDENIRAFVQNALTKHC